MSNPSILLADDDRAIRLVAGRALEKADIMSMLRKVFPGWKLRSRTRAFQC